MQNLTPVGRYAISLAAMLMAIALTSCQPAFSTEQATPAGINAYLEEMSEWFYDSLGMVYTNEDLLVADRLEDISAPPELSHAHALLSASYSSAAMAELALRTEATDVGDGYPACGWLDGPVDYYMLCAQNKAATSAYRLSLSNWVDDLATECGVPREITDSIAVALGLPFELAVIEDCLE